MVTTTKRRIREAMEPSGWIAGVRTAARKYEKYGVTPSLISKWIQKGSVKAEKRSDIVFVDEASLRQYIQNEYTPDRDNQSRRTRVRTIPEMQAEQEANGSEQSSNILTHVGERSGSGVVNGMGAARSSAPVALLDTKEWVQKYYKHQAQRHGENGRLRTKTEDSYDWVFGLFVPAFRTIPFDRSQILGWIQGLRNRHKGGPLGGGSKMLLHRQLSAFYHYLNREFGYQTPNLTNPGIVSKRENALAIRPDEVRAVLAQVRNHSQFTLVLLLAQTGVRIGELCSIRPELIHDHWVEIWGKPTKVNRSGYRQVPLPDESYQHLLREISIFKRLVWVDEKGIHKDLAGPLEQESPPRAINLKDPDTYRANPAKGVITMLQTQLRRLMRGAGVYEPGKNAHSFRRAYENEFLRNGGNKLYMDRILGHFDAKNMADLYLNTDIETLVEHADKFAPRSFLKKEAPQGELELTGG